MSKAFYLKVVRYNSLRFQKKHALKYQKKKNVLIRIAQNLSINFNTNFI